MIFKTFLLVLFTGIPLASAVPVDGSSFSILSSFSHSFIDDDGDIDFMPLDFDEDENEVDSDVAPSDSESSWDCTNSTTGSTALVRCVLKTNNTRAVVSYYNSGISNVSIPHVPPKGVPADMSDFQIKGSLDHFFGSINGLLNRTLSYAQSLFVL